MGRRLNWNRPNGGYETDYWCRNKPYRSKVYDPKPKPRKLKPVNLWGCEQHQAEVRTVNYSGRLHYVLWCLECHKHLKSLSKDDYLAYLKSLDGQSTS